jgi:hypothetical protein
MAAPFFFGGPLNELQRFMEVFVGGQQAHGVYPLPGSGKAPKTLHSPATEEDYRLHLEGKQGLGLVPLREDGTCRFAGVDIDVDSISHPQLHQKVKDLNLPLTVFRSKSGGAHCLVFMKEPGEKASYLVPILRRWAALLGHATSEIFPKQLTVSKKNLGNWLNISYFGAAVSETTRYAMGDHGALSLTEFLDTVQYWDGVDTAVEHAPTNGQATMPPCLVQIMKEGLSQGYRNTGLLNYAIFFRKSSPKTWEEKLRAHNQEHVEPPLPEKELESIIQSAGKTRYQYLCQQEPICSKCNRNECLKLPFGVGHMPWKEDGTADEFIATNLRKIATDPPQYILEVCGRDVALTSEQLFNFRKLKDRVEESLDLVIRGMKAEKWDQLRHELHAVQGIIEAPEDASFEGQLLADVQDFLAKFKLSDGYEDILKGNPVKNGEFVCFRVMDLQRFLKLHRRILCDNNDLYRILKAQGSEFKEIKILGKRQKLWLYPLAKLDTQTEEFEKIKFERVEEEL